MSNQVDKNGPTLSRTQRFLRFPLTRMVMAIFITALAGGLTLDYAGKLAHRWGQVMWPGFLAAAAVLLGYWLYVRAFERRTLTELAATKALPEVGAGLLIGSALVTAVNAACTSVLAGFKQPREVRLVAELPRSTLEKIAKAELRRMLDAEPRG